MPPTAEARHAQAMDITRARAQLVGTLAGQMRGRSPLAAYANALDQIEALHNSPALSDRQARIGTRIVIDALTEALAGTETP
jgi:hypothetical protein